MLDARRIGFDGLSPFFEGMLRQALPEAEFVGVEDMMRGLRRIKLPGRDHLPPHRGRDRRVGAVRGDRRGPARRHRAPPAGRVPRPHVPARHVAVRAAGHLHGRSIPVRPSGGRPATASSARATRSRSPAVCCGPATKGSLARTWWCGDEHAPRPPSHTGGVRPLAARHGRGDRAVPARPHGRGPPRRVRGGRRRATRR